MKRIIVNLILTIILLTQAASATLLLDKSLVTNIAPPYYQNNPCNWLTDVCILAQSNSTKMGQIITVDPTWGAIDSISIPFKIIGSGSSPTLTIRVYKSYANNPQSTDAHLMIWDSTTITPTNTNLNFVNFIFDSPLYVDCPLGNVYFNSLCVAAIGGGGKVLPYIFVELQETYPGLPGVDKMIDFGFSSTQYVPTYSGGRLYQYNPNTAEWTENQAWYNPAVFQAMAFKVYGTFYVPPTPEPTPIMGEPSMTPGDTPQPAPGDTAPPIPGGSGAGYNPGFNNGSGGSGNTPCNNGTTTCNGTIPEGASGVGEGTLPGGALIGMGYDTNNNRIISADEAIPAAYDLSMAAFVLSWLGIFITRRAKGAQRPKRGVFR